MTNEQLTQEIIAIKEHQAKAQAEHERFEVLFDELRTDVKTTKKLAEDVHIMAINMERMQTSLDNTNKKVESIMSKELTEYQENKKLFKRNLLSALAGACGTGLIGFIIWAIKTFL